MSRRRRRLDGSELFVICVVSTACLDFDTWNNARSGLSYISTDLIQPGRISFRKVHESNVVFQSLLAQSFGSTLRGSLIFRDPHDVEALQVARNKYVVRLNRYEEVAYHGHTSKRRFCAYMTYF